MFSHYYNRFIKAINDRGFIFFIAAVMQRIVAIPIAFTIILISPFVKIRLITLYTSRIGEFMVNTYLMLCALESNDFPEEKGCKHFYFAQINAPICNQFLYKMWSRTISILYYPELWSFVDRILIFLLKEKYNTPFKVTFQRSGNGNYNRWDHLLRPKKQFISFTEDEKRKGADELMHLGVPSGKPFICLLVRDSKYLQVQLPNTEDWKYHAYRNANIKNYIPAIEFLTKNGFYVIRMGKHVESSLSLDNPRFIDYANHPCRSDFSDVYLSAHCLFFITTNSGIDAIAQMFNVPTLATNNILSDIRGNLSWIFMISKNVMCTETQSLIPYKALYQDYIHFYLSGQHDGKDPRLLMFAEWKKKKWTLIENTPDEILCAVKEMVDFLFDRYIETAEMKQIQELFWECFPRPIALEQSKSLIKNILMRISPSFLNKHMNLMTAKFANDANKNIEVSKE